MDFKALQDSMIEYSKQVIKDQLEDHETALTTIQRKIKRCERSLVMLDKLKKDLNKPDKPFVFRPTTKKERKAMERAYYPQHPAIARPATV